MFNGSALFLLMLAIFPSEWTWIHRCSMVHIHFMLSLSLSFLITGATGLTTLCIISWNSKLAVVEQYTISPCLLYAVLHSASWRIIKFKRVLYIANYILCVCVYCRKFFTVTWRAYKLKMLLRNITVCISLLLWYLFCIISCWYLINGCIEKLVA